MRIVYCINTLSTIGGIESVTVTKANALSQDSGNKVWIIVCSGNDVVSPAFLISDQVGILSLNNRATWRFPWSIIQIAGGWFSLRKKLEALLSRINPDIVISTGGIDKWLVPFTNGKWSSIREIHGVKNYRRREGGSLLKKTVSFLGEQLDYHFAIKFFDRIVVLTQEDRLSNWKGSKNVDVIPNPNRFTCKCFANVEVSKRLLAVGRLTYQKNFSSLIRAFKLISNKFPDWRLDIIGEGEERSELEDMINLHSLNDRVFLQGNTIQVQEWMVNSSLLVLTSRYEGFGMVLIEAMSCGLPVVSYCCPTGPKDIISDGIDGFLVETGDEKALANRLSILMEDVSLRKQMGTAALEKSQCFSIERIMGKWCDLFQELRQDKIA